MSRCSVGLVDSGGDASCSVLGDIVVGGIDSCYHTRPAGRSFSVISGLVELSGGDGCRAVGLKDGSGDADEDSVGICDADVSAGVGGGSVMRRWADLSDGSSICGHDSFDSPFPPLAGVHHAGMEDPEAVISVCETISQ